ncbi:putative RNA-directed DNA polymerase from transposon BS [Trichonephila inaurata madagascariensis]|uniref:Putative RNA-directed DNA polymerase from transposon BS n=1 Tax=Trichonephila inaurata madagascariensis TaxID=2747483 RepID=A0A8X6M9L7_9ARAC|nr:putative RNA-directed DNA polymerase from transposon BS [Trichonephila inaurata madagascariensis]
MHGAVEIDSPFTHTNNLMPSEQFAFRKGHCTVDQILYFTQCVRDSQNHKPTRHTMVAFLDVSKAFDRVWKYKLLSKCFGVFCIKDSEVNCSKHIEKIADKARKRLKILKYFSGRDWGSYASTLRINYTTLVRPVLEYGYQIFHVASPTNLKKLERVQLSAVRFITGLRYSCLTDIVLYEEDI